MYEAFSAFTNVVADPLLSLAYGFEQVPILAALFLGIVGSVAPCQITGNIGALTFYGNQSLQKSVSWRHVGLFLLGKIMVFSALGLLFWGFGQGVQSELVGIFPWLRKAIGPLLIVVGLFLMGVFKVHRTFRLGKLSEPLTKHPSLGSFFMGVSFSLAFCPTMFVLFFITLMPIVLSTSYGALLPGVFAIGTTLPLLLILFLVWYFGMGGVLLKKSRKVGNLVQFLAGIVIIVLGVLDTLTYWT
ncbi:urease accessory protein UreH domain-containing protein [Pontibacillus salipaludis]|uniref:Cytochrome c biosynthesis protein n=1 Tax=Pontibacillus salipaludis TaxID=1697394 RepID=A0ABQ1Q696_9BACI|nr:sulfite exporter TauE/SafE family protein [Pontibacillus salipaludis]GGD13120.1 cytochrome c biosynthesis protein [Pontibacillus salipaludis]